MFEIIQTVESLPCRRNLHHKTASPQLAAGWSYSPPQNTCAVRFMYPDVQPNIGNFLTLLDWQVHNTPNHDDWYNFAHIAWIRAVRHRTAVPHSSYHLLCMLKWSLSRHCSVCINHSTQNFKGWLRKTFLAIYKLHSSSKPAWISL